MHVYIFYVISLLVLFNPINSQQWYQAGNPHFLDTGNIFNAIKEENTIKIIKFFSPWCKYCRYIKAYMDQFKSKNQIHSNFKTYDFNCHSNGAMFCWQHFQVRAYPSVIVFDEHGNNMNRIDGLYPQDVINDYMVQFNNKAGQILKNKQQSKPQIKDQKQKPNQATQEKPIQQNKNQQKKQITSQKQVKKQQPAHSQKQVVKPAQPVNQQQNEKEKQKVKQPIDTQQVRQNQPLKNEVNKQQLKQVNEAKKQQLKQVNEAKKLDVKPEQIKIQKEMVQQTSLQTSTKPNPAKPQLEKQIIVNPNTNQSGFPFIKYFFYIVGISIAVLYAIKIFTNKQHNQNISLKNKPISPKVDNQKTETKTKVTPKVTTQDIENQILVQEVHDENL